MLGDDPVGVFLGEGFHGPVVREKGCEPAVGIAGEDGAEGEGGAGFGGEWIAFFGLQPAGDGPISGFDASLGGVFAFEAMLEDLELERADGTEQDGRGVCGGIEEFEFRGDAFLEQLVEARLEALVFRCGFVGEVGKALGREARDLVELYFR